MSADRYCVCPRCFSNHGTKAQELEQTMSDSYGKIPVDDFNNLQQEHAQALSEGEFFPENLREDYEFNLSDDGNFSVNYYAMCDKCNFKFSFHHTEAIKITESEDRDGE